MSSEKIISVKCCTPQELTVDCECVDSIPTAIAPLYIYLEPNEGVESFAEEVDVVYKCCNGVSNITALGLSSYPEGITFTNDGEEFSTNTISNQLVVDFYNIVDKHTIIEYPFLFCGGVEVIRTIHIIKKCSNNLTITTSDNLTATIPAEGHGLNYVEFKSAFIGSCCNDSSLTYVIDGASPYVTIDVFDIVQVGNSITLTIVATKAAPIHESIDVPFTIVFTYCGVDVSVNIVITLEL